MAVHTDAATADPPGAPGPTASPGSAGHRSGGWSVAVCVVAGYVLLGLVAFWPLHPWSSQRLFGPSTYLLIPEDASQSMWFLAWVPHALSDSLNPLFSHALFAPAGANLAQNTAAPLLGLLTVPLAPFLGAVARANFVMVLAMPASATAAFVVLRKWHVWTPAAAIGGLAYGFAPYAVGESLAHPFLVFTPLPPLIVFTLVAMLQHRGTSVRLGVSLGLLLSGQFLCSQEIFTTVVLLIAWVLVCVAIRHRDRIADVVQGCWRSAAFAVGVMAVVLAYPVWMLQSGPQHYVGPAQKLVNPFQNDVLSFMTPGPLQRVSFGLRDLVPITTNPSEIGGFIGIPVLILMAVFVWRSRRSPRMQVSVVALFGAVVLSLGAHLSIGGRLTSIPLPFDVFLHLPLLQNLLPVRISFEVAACTAAVIAFGLDDIRRQSARSRRRAGALWATVTVCLMVVTQFPQWPYPSQPVQSLPAAVRRAVPPGDPIAVTYPYATSVFTAPMVWQAGDDFAFRITGGFAAHPGPAGTKSAEPDPLAPPGLTEFLETQEGHYLPYPYVPEPLIPVNAQLAKESAAALAANHVRMVLVDRTAQGAGPVIDLFTRMFGRPQVSSGDFVLWAGKGPLR